MCTCIFYNVATSVRTNYLRSTYNFKASYIQNHSDFNLKF